MDVLIADDHQPTKDQLRKLIEEQEDMRVVGEAASGAEAVGLVERVKPDVAIMDIIMPDMGGIEATRRIKKQQSGIKILGLSNHASPAFVNTLLEAGGSGYVLKEHAFDDLIPALRQIYAGGEFFGTDVLPPDRE